MFTAFAVGFGVTALFQALLWQDPKTKAFLMGQAVTVAILVGIYHWEQHQEKVDRDNLLSAATQVVAEQKAEVEK